MIFVVFISSVKINLPSGLKNILLSGNLALIVMYLALGTPKVAMTWALATPELNSIIQDLLPAAMGKELEHLCKRSTNCVLKRTKRYELTKFSLAKFDPEFIWMQQKMSFTSVWTP